MNMKLIIVAVIALSIGVGLGTIGKAPMNSNSTEKEIAYWVAPMDPNYRRDEPGKSPMGMDLIPVYEGEEKSGSDIGFTVSPNVLASLGVKTSKAEITAFSTIIEATGRTQYDETKTARVQVRSEGWVEKLEVRAIGEEVKKDDLLFTLYSPAIASALGEYGQALATKSKRLETLAIGRLKALGLGDRTIAQAKKSGNWSAPINVYAPSSGIVTKLGVREGSLAAKNTVAFEITDPSNMWLIADVFESQIDDVAIGQYAHITSEGHTAKSVVDYIYPELDPKMQTVRVRINVPNEVGYVRAGQYYAALIQPKETELLTVPTSAIIRLGNDKARVIVAHGEGRFEAAEVIIGSSSKGRSVILSGLNQGEEIVTSGQFMLDSESSFTGAAMRMAKKVESIETVVTVLGTINSVDVPNQKVNITHPDIPEIGWPSMTMDMDVVKKLDLENIIAPTKVHLGLGKNSEGMFVITSIHVMEDM